jgi:phosphoenolpyruvate carboxykinase (GTP)
MTPNLQKWVDETAALCQPRAIILCDGSEEEHQTILQSLVANGTCVPLNSEKRPNSYATFSDPNDVARIEERTFICSHTQAEAGPTNNWRAPAEMKETLLKLFKGCMRGRTLFVIPFLMGPYGSSLSRFGVQITDSPYVVANMRVMTRMGAQALNLLGDKPFVKCLHSVGAPLMPDQKDLPWPCNNQDKYIVHFPEERSIWSFGSGYGGNALLGKKCFALRIASVMARAEGWLAEHMLILGITNPYGEKKYFAAAFPSACGKTNLAMLTPTLPGWKIETVGDDIAWMQFDKNGVLRAINPELGFFGVAPGTSYSSNPNAMRSLEKNSLFTNVALTDEGDVWWEGMTSTPPQHLTDWRGCDWHPGMPEKAAQPNARFTVPARQCPVIDPRWEDPEGVPISAIIFGGRRSSLIPLVYQAFNWAHGVLMGAHVTSEMTAAAAGQVGKLRHDPFAMLPFCGYHMGDYFANWISFGRHRNYTLPQIFTVNWFRKDSNGAYLWPGYGENCRVLKWIFERTSNSIPAAESPIGYFPLEETFDLSGLQLPPKMFGQLFELDRSAWQIELEGLESYLSIFKERLPEEILRELKAIKQRF